MYLIASHVIIAATSGNTELTVKAVPSGRIIKRYIIQA
jgi:hypothetical protein